MMLAVSAIVLLIMMSVRFINDLAQVAKGSLRVDFLLGMMAYRMPEILVMILPLGLFLGIIISYGRLYADSEMTVLRACGMSQHQLLGITLIPSLGIMALIAVLSLYVAPACIQKVEFILATQDTVTEFDAIVPGRFKVFNDGLGVAYSESFNVDNKSMQKVFIANREFRDGMPEVKLVLADHAVMKNHEGGARYLYLYDGYSFELVPGEPDIRATQYKTYGLKMTENKVEQSTYAEQGVPLIKLFGSDKTEDIAELQWRISLPLIIPILVLMAVPLAKINPRQGRFVRFIPALLLYVMYIMLLMSFRGAIANNRIPHIFGMWWVHGCYFLLALWLYYYKPIKLKFARRRATRA